MSYITRNTEMFPYLLLLYSVSFGPSLSISTDTGVEGRAQYSLYKRSEAYGNSGDWTGDDFRHQRSVMVETWFLCLSKCSCSTYAYTTNCLLWTDAKFVVEHSADDAISRDFHVRIAALDLEESKKRGKPTSNFITVVGVVSAAFLVVLSISLVAIKMRRPAYAADDHLMHFEYRVLNKATNNFSEKIGEGGFSSVFRGALPDSTPIAVKKLMNQSQSNEQFLAEVSTVGTIQHVNVVRLIVFVQKSENVPSIRGSNTLDWKTRYGIAIQVAKGLEYLHERCQDCILHYDIKPENMLLDSELEPQIVDFCLAKLMAREVSSVITTVREPEGTSLQNGFWGGAITSKVNILSTESCSLRSYRKEKHRGAEQ
ncbi:G-type lectin S-receptor-like serine/threonine-protein kinase At2g19130 [Eucalyptus grandis]|uniref:G-type lectin S-receptor-like serine/threonine-protein kinase At2g19130 n=1 Tax=Eucalyptus grandis TaxID=71139 RepID=UPI00192E8AEC|nr:G-type lectin S-receptor-like serine/threonine-protein kinase At2g19130 [Eucalyptus grandis]